MILAEQQIEDEEIRNEKRELLRLTKVIEDENTEIGSKRREKTLKLMVKLKEKYMKLIARKENLKHLKSINKDISSHDTSQLENVGGGTFYSHKLI